MFSNTITITIPVKDAERYLHATCVAQDSLQSSFDTIAWNDMTARRELSRNITTIADLIQVLEDGIRTS